MDKLNYYGFQAGIPSYTIPWGVWVNKSLAEDNNISVPDPDWTIDEFTRFVTKADERHSGELKQFLEQSSTSEQKQLQETLLRKTRLI